MKQRIVISILVFSLILITLPFAITLFNLEWQVFFTIVSIIALVYVGIFIFGGLPELIIYSIYGILTILALYFIDYHYQVPIIMIATLLVLMNPLAKFEQFLTNKMSDENTEPIQISIRGERWPFFAYQKDMKNFYHLPQSRKLVTNIVYKRLRQILTIVLIAIGIYSFIHEINHIANTIDNFNWNNFLTFYIIVLLFLLAYFLHIKGFTSTFRTFGISLIPPIIYLIHITEYEQTIKIFILASFVVFSLSIVTIEYIRFFQRVVYDPLYYYDVDMQREVYANALFEPFVYNETYTLCAEYTLKVNKLEFDKQFQQILVYANYFKFIIVAYTLGEKDLTIHAHFYYKDHRRLEKFKNFLESKFQRNAVLNAYSDLHKSSYETKFFHKDAYIIARAQHLGLLLKELHINLPIILSIIVYFDQHKDFTHFAKIYPLKQLNEVAVDGYISAKVDISCINNNYVIETKLRDLLLNLLINKGKFVRLNVYY